MQLRHLAAAIGLCAILTSNASAETHTITQTGVSFDPPEISITVGDTVEWVWTSLSHTITNGTSPSDPNVGTLFDDPLNSSSPTFSFTFDSAGDVPYFCRPHFAAGMTGIIHVIPAVPVEDAHWGSIKNRYR